MEDSPPLDGRQCPYINDCPMFRRIMTDALRKVFIDLFCKGDFELCERKKLRDAGEPVPDDLLPHGGRLSRPI